jgi:hypothetical protein
MEELRNIRNFEEFKDSINEDKINFENDIDEIDGELTPLEKVNDVIDWAIEQGKSIEEIRNHVNNYLNDHWLKNRPDINIPLNWHNSWNNANQINHPGVGFDID